MAFEIRDLFQMDDRTTRKPVWEVYDSLGAASEWTITRATFQLRHVNSGTVIASGDSDNPGEVVINNEDVDRAGNIIRTIQPTIDLNGTDAIRGSYKISFHLYLSNGEDFVVRGPVQIVDFEAV